MGKQYPTRTVVLHWLLVLAWMTLIFTCSSFSTLPDPGGFQVSDKVKHFSAYAVLAALGYRAFRVSLHNWKITRLALATVVLTGLYGATDEFHQSFIPGRMCELGDWLADMAGAVFVVVAISIFNYLRRR